MVGVYVLRSWLLLSSTFYNNTNITLFFVSNKFVTDVTLLWVMVFFGNLFFMVDIDIVVRLMLFGSSFLLLLLF